MPHCGLFATIPAREKKKKKKKKKNSLYAKMSHCCNKNATALSSRDEHGTGCAAVFVNKKVKDLTDHKEIGAYAPIPHSSAIGRGSSTGSSSQSSSSIV
jgi:hypothetical protein